MTRPSSPALWIALLLATALPWTAPDGVAQAQDDTADESVAEVPAEPEDPRASFSVSLDPANGGGRVTGEAGDFQLEPGQYLLATDGVEIRHRDLVLEADTVRLDIPDNRVTAEGNVILDEGPQRIVGDTLEYDLDTRTGRITNARASVDPGYFLEGDEIAKTGDQTFTIDNGVFTSCEGDSPAWSFKTSDATVTIDEYARIRNARLRFGKVPVLYFPYILWPATTERSSGWLIPKPSYSDRRGAHISMAYYRTLGRSADATFYADVSANEYNGLGLEYRYTPTENTKGVFETYYLFEPEDQTVPFPVRDPSRQLGDDRWKVVWGHESKNLWGDWRGVINLELYSDFDYERDIDRGFDRQTRPFQYSNAFLTTNRGNQSWNIMVDQQDRLDNDGSRAILRQLPEVEYRIRSTRLGSSNIYFDLQSSANLFSAEFDSVPDIDGNIEEEASFEYGRFDLSPSISIPLSTVPWLSAKATLAGRLTYYTDSLDPENPDPNDPLQGGSLTRVFPSAALEVVGPSLSKIFESNSQRFSKFKHIIEPRINYVWVDEFDDANRISRFDGIDSFLPQNGVVVSVVNRLLAKPRNEELGGAFEIASFELAQGFVFDDFDDDPNNDDDKGPFVGTLRINPSESTSLKAEAVYDPDPEAGSDPEATPRKLRNLRVSGGFTLADRYSFGLSYFGSWDANGKPNQDQYRFSTNLELIEDKLIFGAEGSFDDLDFDPVVFPERERWLNRRFLIDYRAECYSWLLEYRETTIGQFRFANADGQFEDSEVRFSLTLKNVGTFLDLNESF